MTITNVVLVGANGKLGPFILKALTDTPNFKVSVLTRATSKSTYPANVNILRTDDDLPYEQLVKVLTGQDALVIAFAGTQAENSIKLANAAFEAGVKHIIPADFGSCDSSDPAALDLIPLYVNKKDVRDHLIKLNNQTRQDGSQMSWTSLVTGHFFDFGLKSGLLGIDVERRNAKVFDGDKWKYAASTLAHIGLATAKALQQAEHPRLKNKLVYVQSVRISQGELVSALEKVTGEKFEVQDLKSAEFIKKHKSLLEEKPGDHDITEELVTVGGIIGTDWDTKGDAFVNDLLSMPQEGLEDLVRQALQ